MSDFFDDLETRDPAAREADQMAALSKQVAHAKSNTSYFGKTLSDVDPAAISSRDALADLPVVRKGDLLELHQNEPPFGGLNATPMGDLGRVFMSPGPILDPEGRDEDPWRFGRSLFAAGFRKGDLVHNTFSYHFTPAGLMMDQGARAVGCVVFPAGIGQTELQLDAIARMQPRCYTGTPSFLKILLEKAKEAGSDISSLKKAAVGGEALPPSLRQEIKDLGVDVLQGYGTADLGIVAYESPALEGMILDEQVIVEIVRPGTGEPVAEGEVGEVVVTTLNPHYPLIRFGTGDMSAVMAGQSPCGRTGKRIKGWMGRADQTTKVKGMFVHPKQVNDVVKRHDQIEKARLVVEDSDRGDKMVLHCEVACGDDALAGSIGESIQSICKLRGEVVFVEPGALANDGKVIDDQRSYE